MKTHRLLFFFSTMMIAESTHTGSPAFQILTSQPVFLNLWWTILFFYLEYVSFNVPKSLCTMASTTGVDCTSTGTPVLGEYWTYAVHHLSHISNKCLSTDSQPSNQPTNQPTGTSLLLGQQLSRGYFLFLAPPSSFPPFPTLTQSSFIRSAGIAL